MSDHTGPAPVILPDVRPVEASVSQREVERLWAVANAARRMPRETPGPGSASTVHAFQIESSAVWELDRALRALEESR
jgi:hypothetical protein